MKVLDMYGAGVPVAAVGFECLPELVQEGVNGRVFEDAGGLRAILEELFGEGGEEELGRLREGVKKGKRWEENWEEVVGEGVLPALPAARAPALLLAAATVAVLLAALKLQHPPLLADW
jgi:hypothetical protein